MTSTPTPTRRGRPPKALAQPPDRLSALTAREKALAIKARARHRYTFDMPLDLYEALLEQAENWDQPLPDVVRGCLRAGLDHIRQFGGVAHNPFAPGKLNGPKESDFDPYGYGRPVNVPGVSVIPPPSWDDIPFAGMNPHTAINNAPPSTVTFKRPTVPPGLMPNGATPLVTAETGDAPRTPTIPEDDFDPE